MLRFNKATYLSLSFQFTLSERFSKVCEDQMFYYSQIINKYSIHSVL